MNVGQVGRATAGGEPDLSGVRRGRLSDPRRWVDVVPPATSLWVASVGPAYIASLTKSGEGRAGGPRRGGGMECVMAVSLIIVLHSLRVMCYVLPSV